MLRTVRFSTVISLAVGLTLTSVGRAATLTLARKGPYETTAYSGSTHSMFLQDVDSAAETPLSVSATVAFEAGLAMCMPFLRARARSLARRRELAEDLVQETAMRAWQFRRSFVPGTNMKGWLSTILRNQFYSHGRRDWREVSWTPELDATTLAPPERQKWTLELSDTACAMNAL